MKSWNEYKIDLLALRKNVLTYRQTDAKSKICAVVKADGYGIGAKNVVLAVDDLVDMYAVACFVEAKNLKKYTQKPVLILNYIPPSNLPFCKNNNIAISISNIEQLIEISKKNLPATVHFAINTGMNRIGFSDISKFESALQFAKKHQNIKVQGIFTHFFDADDGANTKQQFCIFKQFQNVISKYYDLSKIICHACASVGATKYPNFRLDMVRLGILMFDDKKSQTSPVLQISTKVVNLQKVQKGSHVGYGKIVAKKDMTIATIPIGYADGVFRNFSRRSKVLCCGKKCKIVGNICMDMMMFDATDIDVKVGDVVVLIGADGHGNSIKLCDVSRWCNTIEYEILTNIKQRRFCVKIKNRNRLKDFD